LGPCWKPSGAVLQPPELACLQHSPLSPALPVMWRDCCAAGCSPSIDGTNPPRTVCGSVNSWRITDTCRCAALAVTRLGKQLQTAR
jgi:hypothetical protein